MVEFTSSQFSWKEGMKLKTVRNEKGRSEKRTNEREKV